MPHIRQPKRNYSEREYSEGAFELYPEGTVTRLYAQIHELEDARDRLARQVDAYREYEWEARHGKRLE